MTITVGAPQLVWFLITVLAAIIVLTKHGEPRPDYNIGTYAVAVLIEGGILYWGGFFG